MQSILFWGGAASMCFAGVLWLAERVSFHVSAERRDEAALDAAELRLQAQTEAFLAKNAAKGQPEAIDDPGPVPELADGWESFLEERHAAATTTGRTGW